MAADLFTLSISTGMISTLERQSAAALEAPYNELAIAVHHAKVTNLDETSWRERLGKAWLWAVVTPLFTVFTIAKNRSGDVAQALWAAKTVRSSAATASVPMTGSWRGGDRSARRTCGATFRR